MDATHQESRGDHRPVTLRAYESGDYGQVFSLWERSGLCMRPSDGEAEIELKLSHDPDLFLVACDGERIVGVVTGGWDGRRAYVYHLAVDPVWRRRRVADRLMDELEERFRAKGALKAKLQILVGNDESIAFFRARGYTLEEPCLPWGKELVSGGAPDDWGTCRYGGVADGSSTS